MKRYITSFILSPLLLEKPEHKYQAKKSYDKIRHPDTPEGIKADTLNHKLAGNLHCPVKYTDNNSKEKSNHLSVVFSKKEGQRKSKKSKKD